ncbi:MAG: hypothetical protein A2445_05380 [Candidatus Jacksonbacteria bacterium RIFOXYC2_FULL_44_29]|nr:MAG: hypothetical protein UW45_C0030G0012 [Parcubacteria group bacterium GW2011_GWC2_44_22]OGY76190.1 MAG: hypothetical protein A2240_04880 [Candidatus Jacksonbacteria bacterium RIFOXYA2_FULL_43_12]OGY77908.1 MAG: hypothetical protein A2295_04550 [Candidatus Jacksonbacteria bacterium RIFOXYB2_FULL_44_15]OGY78710.1 MAG: hypothetical protein A2550_04290 [Candidatus Jacksonbacteria bacterium RIFOXYD2_FULL_43_21]OGY80277.1 MAG: hypothetical protein A2445_05380 [Candidatus Jacksonbacteria bacteri
MKVKIVMIIAMVHVLLLSLPANAFETRLSIKISTDEEQSVGLVGLVEVPDISQSSDKLIVIGPRIGAAGLRFEALVGTYFREIEDDGLAAYDLRIRYWRLPLFFSGEIRYIPEYDPGKFITRMRVSYPASSWPRVYGFTTGFEAEYVRGSGSNQFNIGPNINLTLARYLNFSFTYKARRGPDNARLYVVFDLPLTGGCLINVTW